MNEMELDFSTVVKDLRLQGNMSQAQLAKALDVSPGYISNIESGRSAMTLRTLISFAECMHVSIDYLIGKIDPGYKEYAIDNEISEKISLLSNDDKEKLLKMLRIWVEND